MSKPFSAEHLQGLKLQLAQSNPRNLAIVYADMDPSPGQIRLMKGIVSDDPEFSQIIVKTVRGGGKTKVCSVSFAHIHHHDPTRKIFVHSGSYEQARYLYSYYRPLILNPDYFPQDELLHEPTQTLTQFKSGGFLKVLAASERQSRGGHVDIMCLDEAVLIKQDLIDAVWPTVRTSKKPKRIVLSTASPKVSLDWFLRIWQHADQLKFKRYEWPLEECHWINQQDTANAQLLVDSETFKVEFLGEIAERRGTVWDNNLINAALVDPQKAEEYPLPAADPLTEKWTSLDWGFIGQAVLLFCEKQAETVYIRDCKIWSKESYTSIKQEIKEDFGEYPIYPDSEAVADNEDLRKMGMQVIPVIFSKDKDFLISRVRWRLEKGLLKIPNPDITNLAQGIDGRKYFTLVQQMKAYHYNEKTRKPEKVNDHCCDALICAMKHVEQPSGRGLPITVTSATP